jgi:hypothetical protein
MVFLDSGSTGKENEKKMKFEETQHEKNQKNEK